MHTETYLTVKNEDIKPLITTQITDYYSSIRNGPSCSIKTDLKEPFPKTETDIKSTDKTIKPECEVNKIVIHPHSGPKEPDRTSQRLKSAFEGPGFRSIGNRSKFECHLTQQISVAERKSPKKAYRNHTVRCPTCRTSITKRCLKRHMKQHQSKVPCQKCGLVVERDAMRRHMTKSHFDFACKLCPKVSKSHQEHQQHLQFHDKQKRHPCSECSMSFQHLVELARHVTVKHRPNVKPGKFECLFCKKIVSAIGHHLRTHEKASKTCERCSAVLPNYSAYKAHIRYHDILSTSGRDRAIVPKNLITKKPALQCDECHKKFRSNDLLRQHSLAHLPFSFYPCPFSSSRYSSPSYCSQNDGTNCEEFQRSLPDLIEHVSRRHFYIPETFSQCFLCAKIVKNIREHIQTCHMPDKVECEICEIGFKKISDYKRHYSRCHKLRKEKKTTLSLLMEKYSNMAPNCRKTTICLLCHQKVSLSHVQSHQSSKHRTFKCHMCRKMFFSRQRLTEHEQKHLRASQRCPVCSLSFLSHIRLMAHLKACHKLLFSASKSCSRCCGVR